MRTETRDQVLRYRTALVRRGFSRPIRLGLESELIDQGTAVFDYGCGYGEDLRQLRQRGIQCFGWDPVYAPDEELREADVVNLGYVVNVIEAPEERVETLRKAWDLSRRLMIVSARLAVEAKDVRHIAYRDGYLTEWKTFQKFFGQDELRDWIDTTLGVSSVAAAPGIFFIFRDESLRQSYLASRYRRKTLLPRQHQPSTLFERHKHLLQPLINFVASRGRLPDDIELEGIATLREVFGNVRRAFDVVQVVTGKEQWEALQKERTQDLLVYLALERFNGRARFAALPRDLQLDIKALFGTYTHACKVADELLFSVGNMDAIDAACKEAPWGKLTHEALYIHLNGLPHLPPILRVYEGCARAYIGAVEGANIIKLNRHVPQLSYLSYPNFERDPHPALTGSLLVKLQSFKVYYRDYSNSDSPPILHRKEEFVPIDYPSRLKFERLTRQEEQRGLYENSSGIGTKQRWQQLLDEKGLRLSGHRLIQNSR